MSNPPVLESGSASRSFFLVSILIFSVFPLTTIVSANPTSGTIDTFADGSYTIDVDTDNQQPITVNLTIPRNTTIESAGFELSYDSTDPSPGELTIDLDSDGQYEWHLGGNGDGRLGEQIEFLNGQTSTSVTANGNRTWLSSGSWKIPTSAMLSSSDLTLSFTPAFASQFVNSGTISDIVIGDMDGDGNEDVIYLVMDHQGANGTIWPHVGWSTLTGSALVTSWFPTCEDADTLIAGDANNDSFTDILVQASDVDTICPHFSSNSWSPSSNISMNEKFEDALLADVDGDGQDDLISIDADGTLAMRSFSAGSFSSPVTTVVNTGGQIAGAEGFRNIAVGNFLGVNNSILVGEEGMMSSYNSLWNFSFNSWVAANENFQCTAGPFEVFDWNSDGIHDAMGPTSTGGCMATWNGTAWNTNTIALAGLSNYSVDDHDGDGVVDLFRAIPGNPDGSDSTMTGSVDMYPFESAGGINISASTSFEPHTSPKDIVFADFDGDGLSEQAIVAGESTTGLFIGAWQTIEWDLEGDGTIDMEIEGYAGSGTSLNTTDEGLLINSITNELLNTPLIYDNYDTPWGVMDPVVRSIGAGTITQSNLNMSYSSTFSVDTNPTNGNLSNSLNNFMLLGTGDITVPMNITCTENGTTTISSLEIEWVSGASNIQSPPAPTLSVYNYTHEQVSLYWTNTTSPNDLIRYEIFRAPTGTQISINQPLSETLVTIYEDSDGVTNQNWDYAIRSVHEYGITSSISNIVTVNVPDVPPIIDTTPPDSPALMLSDVPNDNGGVLNLSFIPSNSPDLDYTLIFVENNDFTNASGLTPYANISSEWEGTWLHLTGLTDGEEFWAAAVSVDDSGNAWWNVTAVGPVSSSNDTIRQSLLTIDVSGGGSYDDGTYNGEHVHTGTSFSIQTQLSSQGIPLSDEDIEISVQVGDEVWTTTLTTSVTGVAEQSWSDWSGFLDQWQAVGGVGTVTASWPGGVYGLGLQQVEAATNSEDIVITVDANFAANSPSLQLDAQGTGTVSASASTIHTSEQSLISQLPVTWQLGNGTEILGESGMTQFDSNGDISIAVDYSTGGWLDMTPNTPWWLIMTPNTIRVDLYPPTLTGCTDSAAENFDPSAQSDDGSCIYPDPELVFIEIVCEDNWQILDNSSQTMADIGDYTMTCTLVNNNSVMVFAEFEFIYSESTPMFSEDLSSSEVAIDSGESLTINIAPTAWGEGVSPSNGTVRVEVSLTSAGWVSISDYWIINYVFTEAADIIEEPDNTGNNGVNNDESNSESEDGGTNLLLLIALVAVALGALGFVGLRIAMREGEDEDAEDFSDDGWEPKQKKQIKTQPDMENMPTGRSLNELTTKAAPVSMSKSKRIDRTAGSRPTPVAEIMEAVEDHEEQESEWDYTQDEDYHVDDEGVEWWKDEVGQWWYKYPEDDDWEAYNE